MKDVSIQRIIEIPLEEVQTERGKAMSNNGNNPCLICGREIDKDNEKYFVHLLTNGNIVSYGGHDIQNSQGLFPIGKECKKRLVINFVF